MAFVTNNILKCGAFQIKNFIYSGDTFVIVFQTSNWRALIVCQVEADKAEKDAKIKMSNMKWIFITKKI